MSEKPPVQPKQAEIIKMNEIKKLRRGLNLFRSTIKGFEESDAEKKKKDAEIARQDAIDESLGRKE